MAEDAAAAGMAEYVECMGEITKRSLFIQSFYYLSVDRFPLAVVAETVGLQMRKILELIAKASLAAHRAAWDEVSLWFKRDWNAKAILERIEKVNPRFYPHPVKESQIFASGPLKAEWEDVPEDVYLTKERFIDAYDAIGKMMHAHLPGESVDYGSFLLRTRAWDEQIHELLAMHQVFLLGVPDAFFLVQMNVNGQPTWSQWAQIESGESPQIRLAARSTLNEARLRPSVENPQRRR